MVKYILAGVMSVVASSTSHAQFFDPSAMFSISIFDAEACASISATEKLKLALSPEGRAVLKHCRELRREARQEAREEQRSERLSKQGEAKEESKETKTETKQSHGKVAQ